MNFTKPFGKWFKNSTSAASWGNEFPEIITCCITWCYFQSLSLNLLSYRKDVGVRGMGPTANEKLDMPQSALACPEVYAYHLLYLGLQLCRMTWMMISVVRHWHEDSPELSNALLLLQKSNLIYLLVFWTSQTLGHDHNDLAHIEKVLCEASPNSLGALVFHNKENANYNENYKAILRTRRCVIRYYAEHFLYMIDLIFSASLRGRQYYLYLIYEENWYWEIRLLFKI